MLIPNYRLHYPVSLAALYCTAIHNHTRPIKHLTIARSTTLWNYNDKPCNHVHQASIKRTQATRCQTSGMQIAYGVPIAIMRNHPIIMQPPPSSNSNPICYLEQKATQRFGAITNTLTLSKQNIVKKAPTTAMIDNRDLHPIVVRWSVWCAV